MAPAALLLVLADRSALGASFGYPGTPSWVGRHASRHARRRTKRASPKQYTVCLSGCTPTTSSYTGVVCVSLAAHLLTR